MNQRQMAGKKIVTSNLKIMWTNMAGISLSLLQTEQSDKKEHVTHEKQNYLNWADAACGCSHVALER